MRQMQAERQGVHPKCASLSPLASSFEGGNQFNLHRYQPCCQKWPQQSAKQKKRTFGEGAPNLVREPPFGALSIGFHCRTLFRAPSLKVSRPAFICFGLPELVLIVRERPLLQRADYVHVEDPFWPDCERQAPTGEGLVVEQPAALSQVAVSLRVGVASPQSMKVFQRELPSDPGDQDLLHCLMQRRHA